MLLCPTPWGDRGEPEKQREEVRCVLVVPGDWRGRAPAHSLVLNFSVTLWCAPSSAHLLSVEKL